MTRQMKPGSVVKRTAISPLATTAFFSASSGTVLLRENLSTLAVFDPATGQVMGRASIRPDDVKDPLRAQAMGQGWVAWVKGSMVAMDKSGKVQWKTAEDFAVRSWAGVRVVGGGLSWGGMVQAMRVVEQPEAGQGAILPVFSIVAGQGNKAAVGSVYVKTLFTEGKVNAEGKVELDFTLRAGVAGERVVRISGKAMGHVSSTPEEKMEAVKEKALAAMKADAELGPILMPKGGKAPTVIFGMETGGRESGGNFSGFMYELLSYEAVTGRLVGRQLMGPFKDPVDPETWYLSNNRLVVDRLRPVMEDGMGNRINNRMMLNMEE